MGNYRELSRALEMSLGLWVRVYKPTDTETIVHLFEYYHQQGLNEFEAFSKTIDRLDGAYAILLITETLPDIILFAKSGSPLLIGFDDRDIYFASSDTPIIGKASDVYYLEDGEFGYAKYGEVHLFDKNGKKSFTTKPLTTNKESAQKGGYRFFMEKEIYEQSSVINDTLLGRVLDDRIYFEEIDKSFLEGIESIKICSCGTSYHSSMVGAYLLERVAKIPCSVEIASEFRYKEPLLSKNTLFITISQSGETADTLEEGFLKGLAKKAGIKGGLN